jgi:hypothetical protein
MLNGGMSNSSTVANMQELKTIFSNIEILLNLSSQLLLELEERAAKWTTQQKIGDIFVKMVRSFGCILLGFLIYSLLLVSFLSTKCILTIVEIMVMH